MSKQRAKVVKKTSVLFYIFILILTAIISSWFGAKYHRQLNKFYKASYSRVAVKVVLLLGLKYRGVEKHYPKKLIIQDHQEYLNSLKPEFKAKAHIPKMVKIPAGEFLMGCQTEKCPKDELPVHVVNIKSFEMGVTEVTFKQWDICVAMGGCDFLPGDLAWGRNNMPLINVSWEQMTGQFIPWLNKNSNDGYRLPSESEWEYAARDGKVGKIRPWGNEPVSCDKSSPYGARFGARWKGIKPECNIIKPTLVASYLPSNWGLYDILGNVSEFTQDCENHDQPAMRIDSITDIQKKEGYLRAPVDGSAWQDTFCDRRIMRGVSWTSSHVIATVSMRRAYSKKRAYNRVGFRLARDINH